ncbi:MAG: endopeptidase La, partial [Oscillospiraceae bacterium]|nr:endopeptidase La [Oscillospiraceae bacterium]
DPSAALLEVLDPEQNTAFRDNFLELPFDLSKCMFITTANTDDTIPRPLLDRMEVIEMPGYTDEEKLHIAKEHLFPRQLEKHGLKRTQLYIGDTAMRRIIADYTREAGVRQLEREIAKICRKAARTFAEEPEHARVSINTKNLKGYLGVALFQPDNVSRSDECGIVNGLAWTSVGGEMLEVEVNIVPGSGHIELTGNLGDVMKESARAGISYIRSCAEKLGIDPDFYKTKDMHIHFPEGAIPKDGPSAGITITTALVSALSGRPVRHDVAMTGEITLRGRVLPIGGLREKTMAAFRAGIKTVIIPEANVPNLEEIVPSVREGLQFVPAKTMETVLETALVPLQKS